MHDAHTTNAPWRLIGFELLYTQPQQSPRYLPASEFGANFKSSNQFCRTLYYDFLSLLCHNIYIYIYTHTELIKPIQLVGSPTNGQNVEYVNRVKRPGREADHSFLNSAEVNRTWIYTSTPPHTSSWRSA
jgi:hypothetical protein